MPLIRASDAPATAVRFSLRDFAGEAQELLDSARAQAERILHDSRNRADSIQAEARQSGRTEGWREGYEQGQSLGRQEALDQHAAALQAAVASLTRLSNSIESVRAEVESTARNDCTRLAIAIARRLTRRIGLIDANVLRENLSAALKQAIHGQSVRVAIHPAQRKVLESAIAELGGEFPVTHNCQIIEDDSIAPGGCRVMTRDGQIDATLQGQLDHLTELLLPAVHFGQTQSLFSDLPAPGEGS